MTKKPGDTFDASARALFNSATNTSATNIGASDELLLSCRQTLSETHNGRRLSLCGMQLKRFAEVIEIQLKVNRTSLTTSFEVAARKNVRVGQCAGERVDRG